MENYIAWCEELGQDEEDGGNFNAYDAEVAARMWAGWYDHKGSGYSIASGNGTIVTVKEIESGLTEKYSVSGEAVRSYYASKVPN